MQIDLQRNSVFSNLAIVLSTAHICHNCISSCIQLCNTIYQHVQDINSKVGKSTWP